MWRTELWHPLSVHFPVALLTGAGLLALALPLLSRTRAGSGLRFSYSLLLWAGLVGFWIAYYTGRLAYTIEVRRICDPGVLKEHLLWSYICGAIFSAAAAFDLVRVFLRGRLRLGARTVGLLLTIGGAVCMAYLGHLGAKLVYQQAAGVHVPSEDCAEFSDPAP